MFLYAVQIIQKKYAQILQEKPRIKLEDDKLNQIVLSGKGSTIISKNMIVLPKQTNKDGTTLDEVIFKNFKNCAFHFTNFQEF